LHNAIQKHPREALFALIFWTVFVAFLIAKVIYEDARDRRRRNAKSSETIRRTSVTASEDEIVRPAARPAEPGRNDLAQPEPG
jgi:hypothetical protein